MADQQYTINYDASSANKAVSDIDALTKSLLALADAEEKVAKNRLNFGGMGQSANTATPKITALNGAVAQLGTTVTTTKTQIQGLGAGMGVATGHANSLVYATGNINVASRALSFGIGVIHGLAEAMRESREFGTQVAEELGVIRNVVRELKTLQGGETDDNGTLLSVLKLSAQTGADTTQAARFQAKFEGSVARGVDKGNIDEKTRDELAAESLVMARRLGVNEDIMGRVAGGIPGFKKIGNTGEAIDQLGGIFANFAKGRDTYTEHAKAFQKLAPLMVKGEKGGGFRDEKEAAAALAAVDPIAGSADQAHQMIIQSNRLMSETTGDRGAWLKGIGIEPTDDWAVKMTKLAPHIKGVEGMQKLEEIGFNQKRAREVTVAVANEMGVINKRIEETRATNYAAETQRLDAGFLAKDQTGKGQQIKSQKKAALAMRGLENEAYIQALGETEAGMIANKEIDTDATRWRDMLTNKTTRLFSGMDARTARIRDRLAVSLGNSLRKAGYTDIEGQLGIPTASGGSGIYSNSQEEQRDTFMRIMTDLKEKGVAPEASKAVVEKLDELIAINKQQLRQQQGKPAGVPGVPANIPARK